MDEYILMAKAKKATMAKHRTLDKHELKYGEFEGNFLRKKYLAYLKRAKTEKEMQLFFETNPIVLPGLYDRHNGPLGNVIISKLKLANEYATDFAFISEDSANVQITLIEIGSPSMKVFRDADDQFTSTFNKALQQMRDWTTWFHTNQTYAKDLFRDIYFRGLFRHQHVTTKVILIAGRRDLIRRNSQREKRWAGLNAAIEPNEAITYDHLAYGMTIDLDVLRKLICRPRQFVANELRRLYQ
jgi:hypothetical protein